MAQKCKTSTKMRAVLERHHGRMNHITEMIHVKLKVPVENQAEHIRSRSVEYFEGLAAGMNAALEDTLFEHGCYAGFHYEGLAVRHYNPETQEISVSVSSVGPSHPDFAEWRRHYYTRG